MATALANHVMRIGDGELQAVLDFVRERTGIVLENSNRQVLYNRLLRRMRRRAVDTVQQYLALVQTPGSAELPELITAATINYTSFCRERHHFEHFGREVIPGLVGGGRAPRLRVWSAGCSTGQEAYAIAMTCLEALPSDARPDLRVVGTDIDTAVLNRADTGLYSISETARVPPARVRRWFRPVTLKGENYLQVRSELKGYVAFRHLNLNTAWPGLGTMDAIFCRNVLIDFDVPTRARLLERFAETLPMGGMLYLGHSETVGELSDRYESLGNSVYRRVR